MFVGRVAASHAEQQFDVSVSARTLAFGGALTPGSTTLVAVCHYDNTGGTTGTVTVSGSVNGAYTQCGTSTRAGVIEISIWRKENQQATTAETVTITPSLLSYLSVSMEEIAGMRYSGALRDTQGTTTSSSTTHATPTVTAGAGDFVYALIDPTNQTVSTVDSPFTLITNLGPIATGEGIATAFDFPAATSEAATFRTSVASDSLQMIISLQRRPLLLSATGAA